MMNDQPALASEQTTTSSGTNDWIVTPAEVAELLKQEPGGCLLIDCRTRDEWEIGHIEGAVLAPILDLGQHMELLRHHEDELIVVMCRSGKRSNTVATVLRAEGFPNVKFMAGGIMRWISDVDPDVKA